jgi:hypothetical protein
MMRLLRIISLISTAAACAVVIFVLAFGFRPNLEIQKKLSQASIIEAFKNNLEGPAKNMDKESPLVVQARMFALRIDPPLLIIKKTSPPPPSDPELPFSSGTGSVEITPPRVQAELKLIGTASYTEHPEKSLALLNLVSGGYKWVRQGEIIDQSTVGEIKDGRIVIYENEIGCKHLFVPKQKSSLKSLYKN